LTRFLVVFDVDSTLIEQEAIELLAKRAGTYEQVAAVTERAMRGELDFAQSLRERVATLAGLPATVLQDVAAELTPTNGARELVGAIFERGGQAAAVSGGFVQLLDPVKQAIGFSLARANTLEVVDNHLTGRVTGGIVDAAAKAESLIAWASEFGVPMGKTIAVGDGANDLEMMKIAGLSVAFCAKPIVQEKAKIALNERDLAKLIQLLP
jgi:phosphoserine phosphatase